MRIIWVWSFWAGCSAPTGSGSRTLVRSQTQANWPRAGVQVADIAVAGFPLRFDVSLDQPALPARGWSAPWLRVQVPAWWPFRATGMAAGRANPAPARVDWPAGADIAFSLQTIPR